MNKMNESYETFSKNHLMNSSYHNLDPNIYYNLNPNISEYDSGDIPSSTSLHNTSNQDSFSTKGTFIDDSYGYNALHDGINKTLNKDKDNYNDSLLADGTFIDDSYGYNALHDDTQNMKISKTLNNDNNNNNNNNNKLEKSLNESLGFINRNINIYNNNVLLYKMSAQILEKYFNFLLESIEMCYQKLNKIIMNQKQNDDQRHIRRNYTPLFEHIITIQRLHEIYIYNKIDEIRNYMLLTEKILLKHSQILIRGILFYYTLMPLPYNKNVAEYYENYEMKQNFHKTKEKFRLYFKHIYAGYRNSLEI